MKRTKNSGGTGSGPPSKTNIASPNTGGSSPRTTMTNLTCTSGERSAANMPSGSNYDAVRYPSLVGILGVKPSVRDTENVVLHLGHQPDTLHTSPVRVRNLGSEHHLTISHLLSVRGRGSGAQKKSLDRRYPLLLQYCNGPKHGSRPSAGCLNYMILKTESPMPVHGLPRLL